MSLLLLLKPMNPYLPYVIANHRLDHKPWLCLQKFKHFLCNTPDNQSLWGDFPSTHDDQFNLNSTYALIDIKCNIELVSTQTENPLNSLLLGLMDKEVDWAILAWPDDPEPYSSSLPFPLIHITSEPQPLTSDFLLLLPPIIPTFSSAWIIQSDDNPIQYKPYCLQNPWATVINLSINEDHPKEVVVQEKIHWRKKISKNKCCCRLCYESGHTTTNCWTFKCSYCYNKAPGHWARNCPKKPLELISRQLTTPYNNEVIKSQCISLEL